MKYSLAQLEVILSPAPLLLVAATAGSGKTSVLTGRILRLINEGIAPSRIVALSYTNSAADLIQSRLGEVQLHSCSTLHSFLLKLIQKHHQLLGYRSAQIAALNKEEGEALLEETMAEYKCNATKKVINHLVLDALVAGHGLGNASICALGYLNKMRAMEALTFDGILAYGRKLVRELGHDTLKIDHLLVDEMQDATDADADVYESLKIPNKMFVGDFDQAIFGFREGNPANFLVFSRRTDVTVLKLEENYRSLPLICQKAHRLIKHDTNRIPKEIFPTRTTTAKGIVSFTQFDTDREEYNYLVNCFVDTARNDKFTESAILCRTNAVVDAIQERLELLQIPIEKPQQPNLPADWAKALLAVNLCANPNNDMLARKWLLAEGVNREWIEETEMKAARAGQSLYQAADLGLENRLLVPDFSKTLSEESCKLIFELAGAGSATIDFTQLAWSMAQHTTEQSKKTPGFYVGTVHSAKGREWNIVFVSGFDDAIIPAKRPDIDEERRMAFVALTRARDACIFTSAKVRLDHGRPIHSQPSRFLLEMGLIEKFVPPPQKPRAHRHLQLPL